MHAEIKRNVQKQLQNEVEVKKQELNEFVNLMLSFEHKIDNAKARLNELREVLILRASKINNESDNYGTIFVALIVFNKRNTKIVL